jgi:hypothetical protein
MRQSPCKYALFALGLLLMAPGLKAGTAENAASGYRAALGDNLKAGSAFLAEPFAKGLAFAVGSQGFSPVGAKSLLGFNIGAGLGAGLTMIDKAGLKSAALGNGTDLSGLADALPASLLVPLGTLNARIGLPKVLFFEALDLGIKVNALNFAADSVTVGMSGMGLELRGNVFEAGLVSPVTLTLGLGHERLSTDLRFTQAPVAINGDFDGVSYAGNVKSTSHMESQIDLTTLKASVSRKFLFFTPYAGAALNLLSGEASFRSAQEGSLTFGGSHTITEPIEGKASKPAPGMDVRLGAGFELSFFFLYFAFGGEYGVVSQGMGGHGQVGLQFR